MLRGLEQTNGQYCGPVALAIATGLGDPTPFAEQLQRIRRAHGCDRPGRLVREVSTVEMGLLMRDERFRHLGLCYASGHHTPGPTLARWLRERPAEYRRSTYVVLVTGHYVVVRGRKYYDHTALKGEWIGKCPYRKKRVRWTMRVEPRP